MNEPIGTPLYNPTWLNSRAKLTYNKKLDRDQYGVAIADNDGKWVNIDWGLTLDMGYRFLKIINAIKSYDSYISDAKKAGEFHGSYE